MIKIGLFDSGIGGLSILKEILKFQLPLDIYYYADSLNAPYGKKPDAFVIERSRHIVDKFKAHGIKLIVVACNTATAVAIEALRNTYPDLEFVGVEPFINIINQRPELLDKKGVVLATPLTGNSKRFLDLKNRLDPKGLLKVVTPENLANIIEKNYISKPSALHQLIEEEMSKYDLNYDYFILGCTHYPLVKAELSKLLSGEMISPCPRVAHRFKTVFEKNYPQFAEGQNEDAVSDSIHFMMSGVNDDFVTMDIEKLYRK